VLKLPAVGLSPAQAFPRGLRNSRRPAFMCCAGGGVNHRAWSAPDRVSSPHSVPHPVGESNAVLVVVCIAPVGGALVFSAFPWRWSLTPPSWRVFDAGDRTSSSLFCNQGEGFYMSPIAGSSEPRTLGALTACMCILPVPPGPDLSR